MSEKQYTADEVARQVLSKVKEVADLNKGLFAEKSQEICSPKEWKPETKEQCFNEIRYKVQKIKELKELSWTVEQDAPNTKDIFEKEFAKVKEEIATLLRRCNSLKKDEFNDEEAEVIKAAESVDEIWKAEKKTEKCGDMTVAKDEQTVPGEVAAVVGNTTYKNGKLQNFMNEKKKKKTADMEKKLGIQSAPISR